MRSIIFILVFIQCGVVQGQKKAWIFFRDKAGTTFDPYSYFDTKAIERRKLEGLSLYDSTDYPLNSSYVEKVNAMCDSLCGVSRWFNAVAAVVDEKNLEAIQRLPFVAAIEMMEEWDIVTAENTAVPGYSTEQEKAIMKGQTERMQYSRLKSAGYTGKGVRIAIFDAGFNGLIEDEAFRHIISNGQIKATYDFVKDKKFVFSHHTHGTNVLSCIAGIYEGIPMGCAPDAEFLLARTEQAYKESKVEEENWVKSLEWADKTGADIINSSLGYTRQFYFAKDMNGKRSMISRAASMAVSKGMLVVNSAGNEGDKKWEVIAAPADADSILTIGGIDPWTGYHTDFSSFGPTADGRMKPNLCAFGYAMTTDGNRLSVNSGTSFSSPLVAGFAACIKQMHPEWRIRQVFAELQKCGDLYPYYDYAHGFGVPQASYFFPADSIAPADTSFSLNIEYQADMERFRITIESEDSLDTHFVIQKLKWMMDMNYDQPLDYMYVHVSRPDGFLLFYEGTEPGITTGAFVDDQYPDDAILRVRWRGMIIEKKIGDIKSGNTKN